MSEEAEAAYEELKRLNQLSPDPEIAERGIEVARRVLALLSKVDNPGRWASAQGELCRYACFLGELREDAALVEIGVAAARARATAVPREENVRFWLSGQNNLAAAYRSLAEVTQDAATVRAAIDVLEAALANWPAAELDDGNEDEPELRATFHNTLGGAYQELSSLLGDDTGLAEAVRHFGLAREVWTREAWPEDWAMATYNEAVTLKTLAYLSGDVAVLGRAIDGLKASIELLSPEDDAEWWATRMDGLANALLELAGLTADQSMREEALACYRRALEVAPVEESPSGWARIQSNYAGALVDLGRDRHDPTLLLSAIEAADVGLARATETDMPRHWTALNLNRADAVSGLALLTGGEELLEDVRERLDRVLERNRAIDAPATLAHVLRYSASADLRVGVRRRDSGVIRQAVAKFEEALSLTNRETAPYVWASLATNAADASRHLALLAHEAAPLAGAADLLDQVVAVYEARSDRYAQSVAQLERGDVLLLKAAASGASDALVVQAEADFAAAAAQLGADLDPRRHVRARRGRIMACLAREDLVSVRRHGEALLEDAEDLLVSEAADHGRSALLDLLTGAGEATAYAACRQRDFEAALAAVERGRAFALRTRLRQSELSLAPEDAAALEAARRALAAARKSYGAALAEPDATSARLVSLKARMEERHRHLIELMAGTALSEPAAPPTLEQLREAMAQSQTSAVAVVMATPHAGGALVLTREAATFAALPKLTTTAIDSWLRGSEGSGWLGSYDAFRADLMASGGYGTVQGITAWNAAICRTLETLAANVTSPLGDALARAGVAKDEEVALIVPGRLSALPLHAAGTRRDGRWHTFMDDHPLRYAPGLAAFISLTRRANVAAARQATLIAVTDPEGDLGVEVNPAMPVFAPAAANDLRGAEATRAAVLTGLSNATYASFFAHAWWEPSRPEASHIRLAEGGRLAVADFEEIDLSGLRLVTLGACESGMPGLDQAPDEFQGLPNALIGAGAAAVAATLWPVFNQATAETLSHFYRRHLADGASPARALRDAQRAVRDRGVAREMAPTRSVSAEHWPRAAVQAPQDASAEQAAGRVLGIRRKSSSLATETAGAPAAKAGAEAGGAPPHPV